MTGRAAPTPRAAVGDKPCLARRWRWLVIPAATCGVRLPSAGAGADEAPADDGNLSAWGSLGRSPTARRARSRSFAAELADVAATSNDDSFLSFMAAGKRGLPRRAMSAASTTTTSSVCSSYASLTTPRGPTAPPAPRAAGGSGDSFVDFQTATTPASGGGAATTARAVGRAAASTLYTLTSLASSTMSSSTVTTGESSAASSGEPSAPPSAAGSASSGVGTARLVPSVSVGGSPRRRSTLLRWGVRGADGAVSIDGPAVPTPSSMALALRSRSRSAADADATVRPWDTPAVALTLVHAAGAAAPVATSFVDGDSGPEAVSAADAPAEPWRQQVKAWLTSRASRAITTRRRRRRGATTTPPMSAEVAAQLLSMAGKAAAKEAAGRPPVAT